MSEDPQIYRDFIAENVASAKRALDFSLTSLALREDRELAAQFRIAWAHMQAARETFKDLRKAIDESGELPPD